MARLVLGNKEFEPNCKEINASSCSVLDSQVVLLGERIVVGEFGKVKKLYLVSFVVFCVCCLSFSCCCF